ncbi:hypothetical protein H1R13_25750 [Streptomyces mexicanus]|uniref:DUF6542 domain-containing protein n=2 Tax=Streptomyces mexicanus TaxID=178566 RepID=A0A7X1LUB5_9ACTN|nr:hypothetical protein [Streptomyces mexicanus]
MPRPRLTGLGAGLFCGAVMCALGGLDALLLGGIMAVYGVLFVLVCVVTALWVRRADLPAAPVAAPIGFALGLLPLAEGDGFLGTLMGLVTALATQAVWLYVGTLAAAVTVLLRRCALRLGAGTRRPAR